MDGVRRDAQANWPPRPGRGTCSTGVAWLAAVFLTILMPMSGLLRWDGLGPAMLLILALGYFQAGVHLDRALRWVGLLMGVGYVVVMFVSAYAWTVLGLVLAAALTMAGLRGGRPREATA